MPDTGEEQASDGNTAQDWALERALAIQQEHGHYGPSYIAEMLGQFALEGDVQSIRIYQEIARAYETLLTPRSAKH